MSVGKALVCRLKNIEPIEGADKIVQANLFGETVIISKDYKEGDIGLLFDCETQLSHDFCYGNNLYRHSDLNDDKTQSGYMEDNRRVRPIRLRGVRCSGLWMPITSLSFIDIGYFTQQEVKEGIEIDQLRGVSICQKYITQRTREGRQNKQGKARENLCPTFKEHIDTDQLMRNLQNIHEGDLITITEKLHGTSCRCGYLPTIRKKNVLERVLNKIGINTPDTQYKFIVGSRKVVKSIGDVEHTGPGFYDSDIWTKAAKENLQGKLRKGESVYFEIVGYTPEGSSIMGTQGNSKLKKFMSQDEYQDFLYRYGDTTEFSYGCSRDGVIKRIDFEEKISLNESVPQYDIYVYRITTTNEDGESIDYSWKQVKTRCEQLGVKYVSEIYQGIVFEGDNGLYIGGELLEQSFQVFTDQDSDIFKQHIKEGIVVRVDNGGSIPLFYKSKQFLFKVLEGIIKDTDIEDLEEAQS